MFQAPSGLEVWLTAMSKWLSPSKERRRPGWAVSTAVGLTLGTDSPAAAARSGAVRLVGRTDRLPEARLRNRCGPLAPAAARPSSPPSDSGARNSGLWTPLTVPTRWLVGKLSVRPLPMVRTDCLAAPAADVAAPAAVDPAASVATIIASTSTGLRRADGRRRPVACMRAPTSYPPDAADGSTDQCI